MSSIKLIKDEGLFKMSKGYYLVSGETVLDFSIVFDISPESPVQTATKIVVLLTLSL